MIEGYWNTAEGLGSPARYYDKENNRVVLNNGKTFICIVWKDYADEVVIQ